MKGMVIDMNEAKLTRLTQLDFDFLKILIFIFWNSLI